MSETFKNPTPETLSGEKGPWMVTDMNLEKLGLIPNDNEEGSFNVKMQNPDAKRRGKSHQMINWFID